MGTITKGRYSFLKNSLSLSCPHLGTTLLFWVPTFLFLTACVSLEQHAEEESLSGVDGENGAISQNKGALTKNGVRVEQLYVFTYNNDLLRRLDAWQEYAHIPEGLHGIDSRTGKKISVLCANPHRKDFRWEEIQSYDHLGQLRFNLEEENPDAPLCTGEWEINAGEEKIPLPTGIRPFLSEIRLCRLTVDFSQTAYAGTPLTDVKVYLTNLNAEVALTGTDFNSFNRIINHRGLREEDVSGFRFPRMVIRHLGRIGDGETITPDVSLWAYPNTCPEENMGSPFTRLVIEGKIRGKTYWYPITINRQADGSGKGVERNMIYRYGITLRRSGSADPDIPVDFGTANTILTTEPWKEKEEYSVSF